MCGQKQTLHRTVCGRKLTGAADLKLETNRAVCWHQCAYHSYHGQYVYVGPTFGTFGNVCIMCDQQAIMYWKPKEQFVDINPHITLIMGNQLQVWNWTVWRHQQTFKLVRNDTAWQFVDIWCCCNNIFGNVCMYYVGTTGYYVPQISERFQPNIAEITAECLDVKLFGR